MPALRPAAAAAERDQVSRAAIFAAATTTTPSGAAGWRSIRAWSRPSTARASSRERLPSGLAGLDKLIGGGLERGTSTLIQGAAGTGKSTLSALFCARAAERGEHAALFIFDESANTLFSRLDGLGIPLQEARRTPGWSACSRSTPPSFRPASSCTRIRARGREARRARSW